MHMKSILFLPLLVAIAFSTSTFAQFQSDSIYKSDQYTLKFLPEVYESSPLVSTRIHNFSEKKSPILYGAGYLLQGLKFNSAIDEFNAQAPFDFRGYKPRNFSSYSQVITQNRLLAQPIQSKK